jgi:single-stranded DNA-binding protein
MRCLYLLTGVLALLATAAGQSLRIDERASKVTLNGRTYSVVLTANSAENRQSAVIKLEIIAPSGTRVASSSSPAQLKAGTNKLSASVTLLELPNPPELPKKSDDLLWYRLGLQRHCEWV